MSLLPLPEPYDFELSTGRYRAFGPDLANLWHDGGLHRVVGGRELRISAAPGGVDADPLDEAADPVVRHLVGAPFDLNGFYAFAAAEPVLARVVERLPGLRPPLAPDPWEALVTSISAQQVSLRAAFAIRNRLIAAFGERAEVAYAFPRREHLADVAPEAIAATGFSRRKAETILTLARSDLDFGALGGLPDEEVKDTLRRLPGIGEWTADWFLARHLGRPRAWPAGDLGLRKAVSQFYRADGMLAIDDVRTLGSRFDPFQNLSAHYFLTGWLVAP